MYYKTYPTKTLLWDKKGALQWNYEINVNTKYLSLSKASKLKTFENFDWFCLVSRNDTNCEGREVMYSLEIL